MASEFQFSHESQTKHHTATVCSLGRSESNSVSKVDETASVDEHDYPPVEGVDDGQVDGVKTNSDQEHLQLSSNEREVSNTEKEGANEESDLGRQKVEVVGGSVDSIYLDSGENHAIHHNQETKHQRRPTKAQQAAMEALASFGGSDLGSVIIKKRDLKEELKVEAEQFKSKDIVPQNSVKQPRTRLQAAKQEADVVFKDIPLGEGIKKVPFGYKRKRATDEEGCETKRLSKLDKAKMEALEAFEGAPLESIAKKQKRNIQHDQEKQEGPPQPSTVRQSRVERARAEALHSFGGGSLGDTMDKAKKRVAKTLEVKSKKEDECCIGGDSMQGLKQDDKENLVNSVTQS